MWDRVEKSWMQLGLLSLLPLMAVFTQWDFLFHQASLPRYVLVVLLSGLLVLLLPIGLTFTKPLLVLGVFVFWAVISLFWSSMAVENFIALAHWLSFFLVAAFLSSIIRKANESDVLLWVIAIALVICALIGLGQAFLGGDFFFLQLAPPASTFTNRNFAASACMLVLPFAIWKAFTQEERGRLFVSMGAMCVAFILLIYIGVVQSRGVLLAILTMSFMFCIWVRRIPNAKRKGLFSMPLKLVVLLIGLSIGWLNAPVQKTLDPLNPGTSIQLRYDTWLSSITAANQSLLFGTGVGSFRSAINENLRGIQLPRISNEDRQMTRAHNEYLEILVELGVVGISLWLLLIGLLVRQLFQYRNMCVEVVSLLGLTGLAVHSLFSFPLHNGGVAMVAAMLFAVSQARCSSVVVSLPGWSNKGFVILTCLPLLFFFGAFFLHSFQLSKVYQLGDQRMRCENLAKFEYQTNSFWLTDYPSRSVYSQALQICKYSSERTIELMNDLADKDPTFIRGQLFVAEAEIKGGLLDESKARLERVVKMNSLLVEPWLLLARIAVIQEDTEQVRMYLDNASESGNKTSLVNWYRSQLLE